MPTYEDVHRWADIKMVNYVVQPRENHSTRPRSDILDTLDHTLAFELYANNADARIAFTQIALQHVLADPSILRGPICFVTLVPNCFALAVGDNGPFSRETKTFYRSIGRAARFDAFNLQQMARQALGDIPFIGMVEAVLFYRWGRSGVSYHDHVSWHCHLLTWGYDQIHVSRLLVPFRARHRSLTEAPSAHVQDVEREYLTQKVVYMMKAPQKMIRMGHYPQGWTSPTTGEVKPPGYHSQKDWMQTGHRIRMLDVMGHRTLDELFFGNREGKRLVQSVREEVLAPFHAWQRLHDLQRRRP